MKVSTTLLPLLYATLASSRFLAAPRSLQQIISNGLQVPGENPLSYCEDPSKYPVEIDYVNLDPNPPHPGRVLSVKAAGNITKEIGEGAKVQVRVAWGLITLINKEVDLCDNLPQIGMKCPLKKGPLTVDQSVTIPAIVPPGTYEAKANVLDKDGNIVVCMNAEVTFGL